MADVMSYLFYIGANGSSVCVCVFLSVVSKFGLQFAAESPGGSTDTNARSMKKEANRKCPMSSDK